MNVNIAAFPSRTLITIVNYVGQPGSRILPNKSRLHVDGLLTGTCIRYRNIPHRFRQGLKNVAEYPSFPPGYPVRIGFNDKKDTRTRKYFLNLLKCASVVGPDNAKVIAFVNPSPRSSFLSICMRGKALEMHRGNRIKFQIPPKSRNYLKESEKFLEIGY